MATITVTATMTFSYDTEDGPASNEDEALRDAQQFIDAGAPTSDHFTFDVRAGAHA